MCKYHVSSNFELAPMFNHSNKLCSGGGSDIEICIVSITSCSDSVLSHRKPSPGTLDNVIVSIRLRLDNVIASQKGSLSERLLSNDERLLTHLRKINH